MRCFFMILLLSGVVHACTSGKQNAKDSELRSVYELYSWKDVSGTWSFSIMGTTSRQKTVEEIFDERKAIHGVDRLKQKLSQLERPSRIVWFGKLIFNGAAVKGTERLEWPPQEIIDEVRKYAAKQRIEVTGPN